MEDDAGRETGSSRGQRRIWSSCRSPLALAALTLFGPLAADAALITIEPDAFAAGTNLSTVSPFATLQTGDGGSVYSAPIFPRLGEPRPDDLLTTGPLHKRVFSAAPDDNTEWYAPLQSDMSVFDPSLWIDTEKALVITFNAPVNFVSILGAEIIGDAMCCVVDPMRVWFYDSADNLIATSDAFQQIAHLGVDDYEGTGLPGYPVFRGEFSFPDIHRMVLGGESEPTTLDHLTFRTVDVPEPGSLGLLAAGLLGLIGSRRLRRQGR